MENLKNQIKELEKKCLIMPDTLREKIRSEVLITFLEGRLLQILEKLKQYYEIQQNVMKRLQKKDPAFLGRIQHVKVDLINQEIKRAEALEQEQENPEEILDELENLFD